MFRPIPPPDIQPFCRDLRQAVLAVAIEREACPHCVFVEMVERGMEWVRAMNAYCIENRAWLGADFTVGWAMFSTTMLGLSTATSLLEEFVGEIPPLQLAVALVERGPEIPPLEELSRHRDKDEDFDIN